MKLPKMFSNFQKKTEVKKEFYVSLVLDSDHVAGACFYISVNGTPEMTHAVARKLSADTWSERIVAADEILAALTEKIGTEDFHKVVFGLPQAYLTQEGVIHQDTRKNLKELTKELDLNPVGFVSLQQAIAYKYKHDEGVPHTAIMIGVTRKALDISVYKIGNQILAHHTPLTQDASKTLEIVLKQIPSGEVLPSRILLYGSDPHVLDSLKVELLRHPWPSRLNFLHFPKIEILSIDTPVGCVCIAGASEISKKKSIWKKSSEMKIKSKISRNLK